MKTKSIALRILPATLALLLAAGCASTGNDKAASTNAALMQAAISIDGGSALIDQTIASLNDLVSNPQPDLKPQLKTFSAHVDKLGAIAKDVEAKTASMQAKGAAFFTHWDAELAGIQNENIRSRSESRKQDVAKSFERIGTNYEEVKATFAPFMSDLRDIQKALSTDLTRDGLDAIKKPVAQATKNAPPVQKALRKLAQEFQDVGLKISATGPAPKE